MTRRFRVTIGGITYNVDVEEVGGAVPAAAAPVTAQAPAVPVRTNPAPVAKAPAPAPAPVKAAEPSAGGDVVRSPLPGTVIGVRVEVGQRVSAGDVILVLEAMKMENDITAPATGTVKELLVSKGSAVSLGDALVVIG